MGAVERFTLEEILQEVGEPGEGESLLHSAFKWAASGNRRRRRRAKQALLELVKREGHDGLDVKDGCSGSTPREEGARIFWWCNDNNRGFSTKHHSAVQWHCRMGNVETLRLVSRTRVGPSHLQSAAMSKSPEAVEWLVEAGVRWTPQCGSCNPFHDLAMRTKCSPEEEEDLLRIALALKKADCDPNECNYNKTPPLLLCKSAVVMRVLVKAGADLNFVAPHRGDVKPRTVLEAAAHSGDVELITRLLECGADANAGWTLGMLALGSRRSWRLGRDRDRLHTCGKLLLDNRADPNAIRHVREEGACMTALASDTLLSSLAVLLLEAGGDPNSFALEPGQCDLCCGATIAPLTSRYRTRSIRQLLLAAGADPSYISKSKRSFFHIWTRDLDLLIDAGAHVDIRWPGHYTALFALIQSGRPSVDKARTLLEYGADPNVRTSSGMTPMMSAGFKSLDLTQLLLEYGGNVTLTDDRGMGVLEHGAKMTWGRQWSEDRINFARFLYSQGARPNRALDPVHCSRGEQEKFAILVEILQGSCTKGAIQ